MRNVEDAELLFSIATKHGIPITHLFLLNTKYEQKKRTDREDSQTTIQKRNRYFLKNKFSVIQYFKDNNTQLIEVYNKKCHFMKYREQCKIPINKLDFFFYEMDWNQLQHECYVYFLDNAWNATLNWDLQEISSATAYLKIIHQYLHITSLSQPLLQPENVALNCFAETCLFLVVEDNGKCTLLDRTSAVTVYSCSVTNPKFFIAIIMVVAREIGYFNLEILNHFLGFNFGTF